MNAGERRSTILIAEDDAEDRMLIRDALEECEAHNPVLFRFVMDGEELIDCLQRRGKYRRDRGPLPSLILLDLRMPKKDGYEAFEEIQADPDLRHIPVVVLTTSSREEDIERGYALGVNTYIVKPDEFTALVRAMEILKKYWFEVSALPVEKGR